MRRPREETALRVVELCDGTRTATQIADIMGVGASYVHATVRRRGIRHLLIITRRGSVKVALREAERQRDIYKAALDKLVGEFAEMRKDLASTRERLMELEKKE